MDTVGENDTDTVSDAVLPAVSVESKDGTNVFEVVGEIDTDALELAHAEPVTLSEITADDDGLEVAVEKKVGETVIEADSDILIEPAAEIELNADIVLENNDDGLVVTVEKLEDETVAEAEPVVLIEAVVEPNSDDVNVLVTLYDTDASLDAVEDTIDDREGVDVKVEKLEDDTEAEEETVEPVEAEVEPNSDDVIVFETVYDTEELLDAVGDIVEDEDGVVVVVEKLEDDTVTEAEPVELIDAVVEPNSDDVNVLVTLYDTEELLDAVGDIDDDEEGVVVVVE
jgi:hypothetical protein